MMPPVTGVVAQRLVPVVIIVVVAILMMDGDASDRGALPIPVLSVGFSGHKQPWAIGVALAAVEVAVLAP